MERLQPELRAAYERSLRQLPPQPAHGFGGVSVEEVLRAHFLLIDAFSREGEAYGGIGPRDPNLLMSAVDRQFTAYAGREKWTTPFERIATLFYGLVKNHPFHDGNKRTALLVAIYALGESGRIPTARHRDLETLTVRTASNRLPDYARFKNFAKKADPEVRFLARYLEKQTRRQDKQHYVVTYKQFDALLRRFDVWLDNPHKNFIDVMQRQVLKPTFLRRKEKVVVNRIAHMGFPGWSREVSRSDVIKVRKAAGLMPQDDCDSQVFFKGIEPMESLIGRYYDPLLRLADR